MHVAFVVGNYAPHVGGVETHVQAVAQELTRRSHAATVYVTARRGLRRDGDVTVVGLGRRLDVSDVWSVPDLGASRFLRRDLVSRGVSHISTHTRFFPMTWVGLRTAADLGLPALLTEHGGGPVNSGGVGMRMASRSVDATLGRWSLRSADALFAVSRRTASWVRSFAHRDAVVCGNGIELDFWRRGAPAPPSRRLLFVGRIAAEKGWRDFLTVVAGMDSTITGAIAGAGPEQDLLTTEIARRGLSGRVEVLGGQSQEQLRRLYPGSVYVNPSVASEGFQTTLLEAAACGAVVVTYEVGGSAEVFAAGTAGEVVPSGDAAGLTAATRRALGYAAPSAPPLERYSWPRVADMYETCLRDLS